MTKKIAVIGAGIFGITIALRFSKEGYKVVLFEKEKDIMTKASTNNHFRHHYGYHYPRSKKTALECVKGRTQFEEEFGKSILPYFPTYYSIVNSTEGTLTTPGEFLKFCEEMDLPYKVISPPDIVNKEKVAMTVQVPERAYDPFKLKEICQEKLNMSKIDLRLDQEIIEGDVSTRKKLLKINKNQEKEIYEEEFDCVINATYANMNHIKKVLGLPRDKRQYELMELLVVKIPGNLFGAMNMDGEYTSVIPMGKEGLYTIAHAKGSVLKRIISDDFEDIESSFGKIPSNKKAIMEIAINDFPILKNAQYVKSIFITKTVKANVDNTDERPSEIFNHGNNIYSVFSGKVNTCIDIANKLLELTVTEDLINK